LDLTSVVLLVWSSADSWGMSLAERWAKH
jgi:hypothetical protein